MDLGRRLDEVLQVRAEGKVISISREDEDKGALLPSEEVAEGNELAVRLVLDVDDTPAVLAAANRLTLHDNGALRTNNREGNDVLRDVREGSPGNAEVRTLMLSFS